MQLSEYVQMEADNNSPEVGSDRWGNGEGMAVRCECCCAAAGKNSIKKVRDLILPKVSEFNGHFFLTAITFYV